MGQLMPQKGKGCISFGVLTVIINKIRNQTKYI